jgi:hypothetical protein
MCIILNTFCFAHSDIKILFITSENKCAFVLHILILRFQLAHLKNSFTQKFILYLLRNHLGGSKALLLRKKFQKLLSKFPKQFFPLCCSNIVELNGSEADKRTFLLTYPLDLF